MAGKDTTLDAGKIIYTASILHDDKDEIINMTRAWDKEKSQSPTGIEPMTSRTPGGRSIHWATRTHGERGHVLSDHEKHVLLKRDTDRVFTLAVHVLNIFVYNRIDLHLVSFSSILQKTFFLFRDRITGNKLFCV